MSSDQQLSLERAGLGARLRAARDDAGLSLDEAAARARVPRRHLAAIEDGDAASLPAATYGTAFVKAYAAALGLDVHAASRTYRSGIDRPVARAVPIEPAPPVAERPAARSARWPWLAVAAVLLLLPVGYGIRRAMAPDAAAGAPVAETPHPIAVPPKPVAASLPPMASASSPVRPEQDATKSGDSAKDKPADTPSQDRRSRHHGDDAKAAGDDAPAATSEAAPSMNGPAPTAEAAPHVPATPDARPTEAPTPATATPHPAAEAPPPRAAAPPPATSPAIAAPAAPAAAPPGT